MRCVATERRTRICRYVSTRPHEEVSLADLASDIAVTRPAETGRSGDRLVTRLHHVDLPKLDAVDVVDYDPERRRVAPGESLWMAEDVLNALDRLEEAATADL